MVPSSFAGKLSIATLVLTVVQLSIIAGLGRGGTDVVGVLCGLGTIRVPWILLQLSCVGTLLGRLRSSISAREASRQETPQAADPAPAAGPRRLGGAGVGGLPLPGSTPPQSRHTVRMVWEYIELVVLFCRKTQNVRARACCAFEWGLCGWQCGAYVVPGAVHGMASLAVGAGNIRGGDARCLC
jgi:hypothetical protein